MILPRLTVLEDRYAIGRVLDQERPFEVTYQAWNLMTEDQVVVKEYFPQTVARRAEGSTQLVCDDGQELFNYGLEEFLSEADKLAQIKHASLVKELEKFEANGTAYRVLEHHAGAMLASVLKQQGGKLAMKTALSIIVPILEALETVHEHGLIHAGVTPSAIFLAKSGQPLLIDFQTAYAALARKLDKTHLLANDGFAAPEQYLTEGPQGPWTDVYGVAATLFHVISGDMLPAAYERLEEDPVPDLVKYMGGVPGDMRGVLLEGLSMEPADRPREMAAFQELLLEASKGEIEEAPARDKAAETKGETTAKTVVAVPGEKAEAKAEPKKPEPKETKKVSAKEEKAAPAAKEAPKASQAKAPAAEKKEKEKPEPPKKAKDAEPAKPVAAPVKPPKKKTEDREPAAGRAERSLPGGKRFPVLAALAAVVLVAFVGGYFVMQDGDAGRFSYYQAKGDSLYALADYAGAQAEYEQALALRNDEDLSARLNETQQRLNQQRQAEYQEQIDLGQSRMASADSLMEAGDASEAVRFFAEANRAFTSAMGFNPSDTLAQHFAEVSSTRMSEAFSSGRNGAQADQGEDLPDPQEIQNQLYETYRNQGDAMMRQGDLAGAERKFREALEYRPGDRYASNMLGEIEEMRVEQETEDEFARLIARGNELCDNGRCADAKVEFERALALKPGNQQALGGIARANEAVSSSQQRDQRYQYFRGQGDTFMSQSNYNAAIASYENALEQKPGDAYVQQKIDDAKQALAAQAVQEQEQEQAQQVVQDGVYIVAEEQPQLIGGLGALHRRVRYPQVAYQSNVEGRVYVQFVVDERGRVQDPEVIRGLGAGCDEEAVRVISESRFEPGKVGGEPVKVRHTLFVEFRKDAN